MILDLRPQPTSTPSELCIIIAPWHRRPSLRVLVDGKAVEYMHANSRRTEFRLAVEPGSHVIALLLSDFAILTEVSVYVGTGESRSLVCTGRRAFLVEWLAYFFCISVTKLVVGHLHDYSAEPWNLILTFATYLVVFACVLGCRPSMYRLARVIKLTALPREQKQLHLILP